MNKKLINWLLIGIGIYLCAELIDYTAPYDSTDNGEERSGMRLYTDNQTGCQYLSSTFGSLVKRVDGEGNHVGCL